MFNLLIVEDEDYVRESLAEAVEWSRADCRVAAAVRDPQMALDHIRNHPVDIVLSDIRMDSMDGLELARQVQSMSISVPFIFITGYGDINYARRAFERHAWDFILKPIQPEKLLATTKALTDKLRNEKKDAEHLRRLEKVVSDEQPLIRQYLLRRVLGGESEEHPDDVFNRLIEADVPSKDISVALVEITDDGRPAGLRQAMATALIGDIAPSPGYHGVSLDSCALAIVGPAEAMMVLANRLVTTLRDRYKLDTAIGVSASHPTLRDSRVALAEARQALLEARIAIPPAVRQHRSSLSRLSLTTGSGENEHRPVVYDLFESVMEGRVEEVIRTTAELESDVLQAADSATSGYEMALRLQVIAEVCLHRLGIPFEGQSITSTHMGLPATAAFGLSRNKIVAVAREALSRRQAGTSERFNAARKYIEEHFDSSLTLTEVASACSLSSKYLCRLIKKHTGSTFSWLLADTRIRNAEVLLSNPATSISGVAYSVGFSDPSYFSRVFKRLRGVSPEKFRNHLSTTMSL